MKKVIFTLFLLFTVLAAVAQEEMCMKEKIKAKKVAFITDKVGLTVEEAQVFWPLYNEFEQKRQAIYQRRKKYLQSLRTDFSTMSEAKKEELADDFVATQVDEAELNSRYHEKFKEVLSIEKIIKLYHAEYQFKRHLLEEIPRRHKRGGRNNGF